MKITFLNTTKVHNNKRHKNNKVSFNQFDTISFSSNFYQVSKILNNDPLSIILNGKDSFLAEHVSDYKKSYEILRHPHERAIDKKVMKKFELQETELTKEDKTKISTYWYSLSTHINNTFKTTHSLIENGNITIKRHNQSQKIELPNSYKEILKVPTNKRILYMICLLHDLGKCNDELLIKNRKINHYKLGSRGASHANESYENAVKTLEKLNFPKTEAKRISYIIKHHHDNNHLPKSDDSSLNKYYDTDSKLWEIFKVIDANAVEKNNNLLLHPTVYGDAIDIPLKWKKEILNNETELQKWKDNWSKKRQKCNMTVQED